MSITATLDQLNQELLSTNCTLVAVSKTKPADTIKEAYDHGQRDFGENKVQELAKKYEMLPKDIRWHMIGHLQSNKVKFIAPFVHVVHAVDSEKLLATINKEAKKNDRSIDCLLQVHIAQEKSKFGLSESQLHDLLGSGSIESYENLNIIGLMGMATNTYDEEQVSTEFQHLKRIFDQIKSKYTLNNLNIKELSIGMSGDYKIALKEGSTMVRIGSTIFGERNYP